MSTFDYDEIADTAAELLAEFGTIVKLRAKGTAAYDVNTSRATPPTPVDRDRNGVLLDFDRGKKEERGQLIQAKDKRLIMEAGVIPSLEDVVIVGSTTYSIVSIGEASPAGLPIVYNLHLRNG